MEKIKNLFNIDIIKKLLLVFVSFVCVITVFVNNVYADDSDNNDDSGNTIIDYSDDLDILKVDIHNIYSDIDSINDMISNYYLSQNKTTFDISTLYLTKINNYYLRDEKLVNWFKEVVFDSNYTDVVIYFNKNYPNQLQFSYQPYILDNNITWFLSWYGIDLNTLNTYTWANSCSLDNCRVFYLKVNNQVLFDGVSDTYNTYLINNIPNVLSNSLNVSSNYSNFIVAIFVVLLFIVFKSLIWGV